MSYAVLIKESVSRESYRLGQRIDVLKGKKIAIFPAGPTAQEFYSELLREHCIEAEFFIDNNPTMEGKLFHGKPVKLRPWETIDFNNFAVLIATAYRYYEQIAAQLEDAGISDYMHYGAFLTPRLFERYDAVAEMLADEESKCAYWGAIYSLMTGDNKFIRYESNAYFAIREFAVTSYETVVDAGAYVGDTIEEYVKRAVTGLKIYAFEPFHDAARKLEARVKRLKQEWILDDNGIEVIVAGIGVKTETLRFSENTSMIKPNENGRFELPVYSLDDYFKDKPPFTLLKADIEGSELEMLQGAKDIIRKYKPKMAICIYHNALDFAGIAEYVRELVPDYRLYVRNHGADFMDTVLYCVV
jgi:FkbM family methyltransferase